MAFPLPESFESYPEEESTSYLIVGLGNPGKEYEGTRHNIGFRVVQEFARKHALTFKKEAKFKGSIAQGKVRGISLLLLLPTTYMNLSGEAVALTSRYYKISLSRLAVVTDEVDLPLGQLRWKINSGAGSHNGLKSVEASLQTQRYARLRMGVGDRTQGDLASHVLSRFSPEEEGSVSNMVERALQSLEIWLDQGITSAMDFANRRGPSTPSIGEENEKREKKPL